MIVDGVCQCLDCRKKKENLEKHLNHPFYQKANNYREEVRIGQIKKGSEKYLEPFNPKSWTAKELLEHAMQENVDQAHYIYGLYEKIEEYQKQLEMIVKAYTSLKNDYETLEKESGLWRGQK